MAEGLRGKVALVTASTGGIGKATAIGLAQSGATVIVVGRDQERGETALAEIKQTSGNPAVELVLADLSSQASVRKLAETVMSRHDRLHILVNNVGAMVAKRQETADGVEAMFAINYLNIFLLTDLLLQLLKASAPARIINVSSDGHRFGKLDFDDLQSKHDYLALKVYGQAKLALVLYTYELARRLEGSGVTANVADPGNAETEMTRNITPEMLPSIMRLMWPLRPIFSRLAGTPSIEAAAQSSIYLAESPDVEGINGKYFSPRLKPVQSAKASYDEKAAERLWNVSERLLNLQQAVSAD